MFDKLREKTGKNFIKKYAGGGPIRSGTVGEMETGIDGKLYQCLGGTSWVLANPGGNSLGDSPQLGLTPQTTELFQFGQNDSTLGQTTVSMTGSDIISNNTVTGQTQQIGTIGIGDVSTEIPNDERLARQEERRELRESRRAERLARQEERRELRESNSTGLGLGWGASDGSLGSAFKNLNDGNFKGMGVDLAVAGVKALDDLTMGDKNFGAQSEAIDSAVHGVSGALMKSGNPYAMIAGAALEGANFLTKAGGQTVQGFDVDINSSGYGQMGHMESSSSRDFGAMLGLGGLNSKKMQGKLAKRNQQALMAMNAANIANEQSFEQEARMNSISNTIENNRIALAGGLETSLLGG